MKQNMKKHMKWLLPVVTTLLFAIVICFTLFSHSSEDPGLEHPLPQGQQEDLSAPSTSPTEDSAPQETPSPTSTDSSSTDLRDEAPSAEATGSSPSEFTVSFLSPDGRLLFEDTVYSGHAAQAPTDIPLPPTLVFSHWDRDFSYITEDLTVSAVCRVVPTDRNVFTAQSFYVPRGKTTAVSLRLCGKVCLCACNLTLSYDPSVLEFVEFRNVDGGAYANCIQGQGKIKVNYAGMENTTAEVDLAEIIFRAVGDPGQYEVSVSVEEAISFDESFDFVPQDCDVIPAIVTITKPTGE